MSSASLVCSVLDGNEELQRVFIQDTVDSCGRGLLKYGVCQLANRCNEVHVMLQDVSAHYWVKGLPPQVTAKLNLHDCTRGLLEDSDLFLPAARDSTAVVVDSLSFLLLKHSPATLCRWLTSTHHTLCLLHSDLHDGGVISQMDYVATSSLKVATPLRVATSGHAGLVTTTHRKSSGKVLCQTECYSISADCASLTATGYEHIKKTDQPQSKVDPAANLTFDLHLTAQEKAARSQVVLPYTSAQEEEGLVAVNSLGSGRIFYEPDEEDCFGDSDPDDDLDI